MCQRIPVSQPGMVRLGISDCRCKRVAVFVYPGSGKDFNYIFASVLNARISVF